MTTNDEPQPEDFARAYVPWATARRAGSGLVIRERPVVAHDGTVVPEGVTIDEYEAELVRHGLSTERARRCIARRRQVGGECQPDRPVSARALKLRG